MDARNMNFAAMPQTAITVITKPGEFFQSMPRTGGFLEPLLFAVVMGVVAGIIYAVLSLLGLGQAGHGPGMMSGFGMILFMPIAAAVGSFIGAAILFVIWKLMGSPENYETAYRCCAYLMALSPVTAIISAIPYAGGIISMAIYIFYVVTVSVAVHHIPAQKAWLVFGIIGVVLALLGVFSEYRTRSMSSSIDRWRQMGEEYRKSAEDVEESTRELREQAGEMAKKFKEQAEEARKQAEENQ